MAKKSTQQSTTNQTQNVVSTPTNPAWVDSGLADMGGLLSSLSKIDPARLVAGPNALQQQAAGAAANLGTFGQPSAPAPAQGGQGFASRMSGLSNIPRTYDASGLKPYDPSAPVDPSVYSDDFGGGRPGTLSAGGGGGGPPMASMGGNDAARAQDAAMMNDTMLRRQAAAQGSGVTDPYGSAMSTFDRMQSSGANTYDPALSQAAGYTAATGTGSSYNPATAAATSYDPVTGKAVTGQSSRYNPATYNAATGTASLTGETPQVQAASLLDNLPAYMSPYTNDVVNSALADFDYGAGQNEGQAKLDLAGDSTFGGSGGAIGLAALRADQSRGRGTLSANLRDQAFQTGANLSNLDAGRRQSASSENAASAMQRALADMQAKNTYGLANLDALNTASRDNQGALNTAGQFNAGNEQAMTLANLGAENTYGLANMDALNDAGATNAGLRQQVALSNQSALNTAGATNAGLQQQMSLANMDALNSAGATNAGFQQQTGLANQGATNSAGQFNAAQRDAALARQMAGAQGLVNTANDQQGQQRANIDTQSQLGEILRQIQQQQNGAPFSQASLLAQLWQGLPLDLLHGGTTNATTNGTSRGTGTEVGLGGEDLAKIAAAAIMASDRRLKHGVERIGKEPNGLGVYEFSYHGSADRYVGYMADEVAKVKPEAVVTMPNGFYAVDYGKL